MRWYEVHRRWGGSVGAWGAAGLLGLVVGCDRPAVPGPGVADAAFVDVRPGLSVEVRDADGRGVADAWVVLSPGGREARTDADGVATLAALGPGEWTVTARAEGHGEASAEVVVDVGDAVVALALPAGPPAGSTLAGRVTDPAGAPVAGATITVDGVAVAVTDADGAFAASGLDAGTVDVRFEPPAGTSLHGWASPGLVLAEAGRAEVAVVLPAGTPEGARFLGSSVCSLCHADEGARWAESAHARAGRDPAEVETELSELAAAFVAGDEVALDATAPGAAVRLGRDGDGTWRATVVDGYGGETAAMAVVEVYGGHRVGAALAVDAGGAEALLPAAWALAGRGTGGPAAGWVAAWGEGWFDADGRLVIDADGRPGPEASWALQCAGCHATGAALAADGDAYALVESADAWTLERRVGCEACHGRGTEHSYDADGRALTLLNPARLAPAERVEVCARCHERAEPDAHPFADAPGWPVDGDGEPLGPLDPLADYATAAPVRWLGVAASRVGGDQVGDFRTSPHHQGPGSYAGACEDCHDPHGSEWSADLRADPADNTLCTSCHASRFPDEAAQAEHAHHETFHPGPWSPGACTGCHLPRTAVGLRPDPLSGAGELRSHGLVAFEPSASLAEFDAAGASVLDHGAAPVSACLDCHLQADEAAQAEGDRCPCPTGDARKRATHADLQGVFDRVWGAR